MKRDSLVLGEMVWYFSPPDVLLPVLRGEAEVLVKAMADVVAVQSVGGDAWEKINKYLHNKYAKTHVLLLLQVLIVLHRGTCSKSFNASKKWANFILFLGILTKTTKRTRIALAFQDPGAALTPGDEVLLQCEGDGGLSRAAQAREPDSAAAELVALGEKNIDIDGFCVGK